MDYLKEYKKTCHNFNLDALQFMHEDLAFYVSLKERSEDPEILEMLSDIITTSEEIIRLFHQEAISGKF